MLKHDKFLNLYSILNKKGMTIVEVLVAAGLASIVSLGVATMVQNMMIEQKRVSLFGALREIKLKIENTVRDQASWSNTISDTTYNTSAVFTSLRASTAVTVSGATYTAPLKVVLYDGAGALALGPGSNNFLDWADVGTAGFTETGARCNTFTMSGSDTCPISYRIVMAADCGGAASCVSPQLKVVARLVFKPTVGGTLDRFSKIIGFGSMTTIADGAADGKYDVYIRRSATQVNRSFKIAARRVGGGAVTSYGSFSSNCATNGAGACTTAIALHPATAGTGAASAGTSGWWFPDGASSLVTLNTSGTFTINEQGTYQCNVTMAAFASGGISGFLYRNGASLATGSTTAGKWSGATLSFDTRFVHPLSSLAQTFDIRQQCQAGPPTITTDPGSDPSINNCTLGLDNKGYYGTTGTDVVTVSCTKIEDQTN